MSNDIKSRVRAISQQLPGQAGDEYYATPAARLDTILGHDGKYALRLQAVKAEWDQRWKSGIHDLNFPQYLKEHYGVKMKMTETGLDLSYDIVDEQKHTIFLLKFSV